MTDWSRIGKSNVRSSKEHERRVAQLLTDWSGIKFRRRRVEGRDDAVRIVELVADVIPCEGDFHFSIECKKGKDFSLDALMGNPTTSLFTTWWHQACYDAQLVSTDLGRTVHPMMFFKPVPNWDWVAVSARAIPLLSCIPGSLYGDKFYGNNSVWFPHLMFDAFARIGPVECDVSHSKKNKKMVKLDLDPLFLCRWRDFEANVDPKSAFISQK